MLGRVVAADGPVDKGPREHGRVGDVEEVGDVEGRGGLAVGNADGPALLGEAAVPGADVTARVRVHVCEAAVPEEPDVLLVRDGLGVEEVMVDVRVWAEVEEVRWDGMDAGVERVGLRIHRGG